MNILEIPQGGVPEILCEQIVHFFQHYKDLEKGKWVTVVRWAGPEEAAELIREAIKTEVQGGARPTRKRRLSGGAARSSRR